MFSQDKKQSRARDPQWSDIIFDTVVALLMLVLGLGFFAYLVFLYA